MSNIKNEYQIQLDKYIDKLVQLGKYQYQCEMINTKATSIEYKKQCIDNINKRIEDIKEKIKDLFNK